MDYLRKFWEKILELVYPKTCVFCGKLSDKEICDDCRKQVEYIQEPRCKKCGKPVRYEEQEYCHDCQRRTFYYEQGKSLWVHKGRVPWSVYQFKYHNRRIYGRFYAKELYRLYGKWILDRKIDLIIPVPLHPRRRRKRGYNQAYIIAKYLGEYIGLPVDFRSVTRKKYTQPQKVLDNKQRRRNLKDAFEVKTSGPFGKRILVIDDIYTTGSTVDGVAQILLEKGHNKVWFLTISIGQNF